MAWGGAAASVLSRASKACPRELAAGGGEDGEEARCAGSDRLWPAVFAQ